MSIFSPDSRWMCRDCGASVRFADGFHHDSGELTCRRCTVTRADTLRAALARMVDFLGRAA